MCYTVGMDNLEAMKARLAWLMKSEVVQEAMELTGQVAFLENIDHTIDG